jgi:hypothetical protein
VGFESSPPVGCESSSSTFPVQQSRATEANAPWSSSGLQDEPVYGRIAVPARWTGVAQGQARPPPDPGIPRSSHGHDACSPPRRQPTGGSMPV